MTFSASPMVPTQRTGDADTWRRMAQQVFAAVTEGMPLIPSADPLIPDAPSEDLSSVAPPAGTAIRAVVGGAVEGALLLIVAQELVDALAGTPFGAVPPAQALRPAFEAMAASLGGQLQGTPTEVDVDSSLATISGMGGTTVLVPLLAGDTVHAMVAVSLVEAMASSAGSTGGGSAPMTAGSAARSWGIDMLRDVEMEVTCELGRTKMTVRQLLALAPGDVVELDRLAGSPADLLVNGTLLARGEVVVVDESFGLRITEIVTKDAT